LSDPVVLVPVILGQRTRSYGNDGYPQIEVRT
jgi:hypothetical protein